MRPLLLLSLCIIMCANVNAAPYYISNSGNDANNGTSPATPWKTIAKINSHVFSPGDSVFFKRGDQWREKLTIPSSGSLAKYIYFGPYGAGPQPKIVGSTSLNAWTLTTGNIWVSNSTVIDPASLSGKGSIFFQEKSGKASWGRVEKTSLGLLTQEYDWTWSGSYIYIYAPTDPNTRYNGVEVAQRDVGISLNNKEYLTIDNLEIAYLGSQGISEVYPTSVLHGLNIYRCSTHHTNVKNGPVGCGLSLWHSDMNILYDTSYDNGRRNIALDTYASSVTVQNVKAQFCYLYHGFHTTGFDIISANPNMTNYDISFNTIFEDLTETLDEVESFTSNGIFVSNQGTGTVTHINIHNNIISNNTSAGIDINNVDQDSVYNNTIYGVCPHSMAGAAIWNEGSKTHSVIRNNVSYNNSAAGSAYSNLLITNDGGVVSSDYNLFFNAVPTNKLVQCKGTGYNQSQWATYKTASSQDTHSLTPANPLFVSSTNLHLQSGSSAINTGTFVGMTFFGSGPDLGAFESGNSTPVANAGADQSITLPAASVVLNGTGTDADGAITSYLWSFISGPGQPAITSATSATTNITGLSAGNYIFQLQVTDNSGTTATDQLSVYVNPAANVPPVCQAGPDQSIQLPINNVTLSGNGTDSDGIISSYVWTKISGPSSFSISSANSATTAVTGLNSGTYQFELKVTDNSGATAKDTVQVLVSAGNIPPTSNAGTDQTIQLPANSVSLNGIGSDADGTITYSWTKISGPASGTITNSSSATTTVTGMMQGTYQFQLQVTDNSSATAVDVIQVTVVAGNIPPTSNAGTDQTIQLPANSVSLNGIGSDADGTITYSWTKISGPASGTITNSSSATTTVTGMMQGTYQFQLQVTDNSGATALDVIQVTVVAGNIPPTSNAGTDQTIQLPANSVSLNGIGSDADGTITYSWTKISGPASGTITNSSSATTTVTGMMQGTYQFQLQVTDNSGATALDVIQVTVVAGNIPPTSNAGTDQTIQLPANTFH